MKWSKFAAVLAAAVVGVLACGAYAQSELSPNQTIIAPAVHIFGTDTANRFMIGGVAFTGTAAQLNNAVAVSGAGTVAATAITGLTTYTNVSLLTFSGTGTWTTVTNIFKAKAP